MKVNGVEMKFDKTINLGNVITLAMVLISMVVGFVRADEDSKRKGEDIETLKHSVIETNQSIKDMAKSQNDSAILTTKALSDTNKDVAVLAQIVKDTLVMKGK